MSVKAGIDYIFAREITYAGFEGMGKGCLIGTHNILLQFPTRTNEGMGRTITSKLWLIDGKPVREALTRALNDPELTQGDLDRTLRRLGEEVPGSVLIDFALVRRLKVKSSLLSRGIYTSDKSSGHGWRGFPLKKEDAKAFGKFYEGHPAAMGL